MKARQSYLLGFDGIWRSPVFRRKWPSLYEALDDCRPNRQKLMKLYLREIPTSLQRPIIAGDHTPWPRTEAPTLKDRKR